MRLFRAHGLGNDYLVVEAGPPLSPALVAALCDRHEGVGGDGILEPIPGRDGADFGVRILNPDGSEAEKSGNGLRILAWWLHHRRGAPAAFTVWTAGGIVGCRVDADDVRVAMGAARVSGPEALAGEEAWRVDIGNPHAVVFGWPDDWEARGAAVERAVPGRTNVQFVRVEDGAAHVRVWERGAGRTRSSGSSACAVAAVCVARGLLGPSVRVEMEGGVLAVEVGEQVHLRGPVEAVAVCEVDERWLRARAPARGG